jgi:ATP-dependent exoDNAse (exonuclease V) alpha subunit
MTTLTVRAAEQAIERHITQLATPTDRQVGEQARELAREQVAERIGGPLSPEQQQALQTITGPERAAVLIGPAGTGKGVVIDAAALAEQHAGREPIGVAVSWSTAERLASDSQALHGRTFSVDALLTRQEHGLLEVGEGTTIFFDEAGMADTRRLHDLTSMVDRTGAKLVLIGDAAQLPSIGAGGMFDRLTRIAPCVELSDVRRTLNPAEQKAWADLRAGRSDRAMAYYHSIGQLHMNDTRDQAVEYAVNSWAELTKTLPVQEVALLSDASNHEIHRLNARAQHHRYQRGELGDTEAPVPGMHYGLRQGDRIVLVKPLRQPGVERVENGSDGHVLDVTEKGEVLVHFDLSGQQRTLRGEELEKVRLAYARHIHRAQGATVTRSLVVTGGWQTSKEPAYVHASRARNGTDWFINRTDLGQEGQDHHRISRLAQRMQESRAQIPSLQHPELPDPEWGLHAGLDRAPSRTLLANMPRLIERLAEPLSREPER